MRQGPRVALRQGSFAFVAQAYIEVSVRRSIARLTCVDRPSAYQTGGQFDFAKNDLVGHHFLGAHVRQQHGSVTRRESVTARMPADTYPGCYGRARQSPERCAEFRLALGVTEAGARSRLAGALRAADPGWEGMAWLPRRLQHRHESYRPTSRTRLRW